MVRELITIIVFIVLLVGSVALAYGVKCDKATEQCLEEKK